MELLAQKRSRRYISELLDVSKNFIENVARQTGFKAKTNKEKRMDAYKHRNRFSIVINPQKFLKENGVKNEISY